LAQQYHDYRLDYKDGIHVVGTTLGEKMTIPRDEEMQVTGTNVPRGQTLLADPGAENGSSARHQL